ncbi:MAG: phosphomannose isomerase type II C-terminal cupin domain [Alphaproteobacteria bacterium]|nr:phosphomannose isomerase type II C-terminal cupin domain [Alphaproteobacteria bacterium]
MHITYQIGDCDTREWGTWEVLNTGDKYIIKKIIVLPDSILSLQKHLHRNEHWIIIQGQGIATLGKNLIKVKKNDSVYIPKGKKHRIENRSKTPLVFIEIQTGDILDENDIIRFEDKYGRI